MALHFDPEEREYLLTLLHDTQKELVHELHHTDSVDYKERLRARVDLNERLIQRLESAAVAA